ncbi:MAG: hypothetical protein ABIT10_11635 [Alteraurantiacibacter sp.]
MTQQTTRATPRQATSYMTVRDGPLPSPDDPLLQFAPVPHVAPRRNSITPNRQREFIANLAATGIVSEAARAIGASMEALYKLRHKAGAEEFSAAWDAAVDRGVERLEDGALARAIRGEERMVVSGGQVLGTEIRHNDALVMFFLKHRRAARYGTEVRPGQPLYERIRAEVIAQYERDNYQDEEEVLASLNAKIDAMMAREAEIGRERLLEECGRGELEREEPKHD